jgi:hypothetical protein
MRDNMTRREFTAALILAPMTPTVLRAQQIVAGTNLGMKSVKLAVPEFRPTKPEPKINHLADVFNETLWNDLDFSGTVALDQSKLFIRWEFCQSVGHSSR